MKSPSPSSPRGFLPPSPLVFTPTKIQVEQVVEVEKVEQVSPKKLSCLNCEEEMTPGHQCDSTDSESNWEDVESDVESEDWAEEFSNSIRRFHGLNPKDVGKSDREFSPAHQCYS